EHQLFVSDSLKLACCGRRRLHHHLEVATNVLKILSLELERLIKTGRSHFQKVMLLCEEIPIVQIFGKRAAEFRAIVDRYAVVTIDNYYNALRLFLPGNRYIHRRFFG